MHPMPICSCSSHIDRSVIVLGGNGGNGGIRELASLFNGNGAIVNRIPSRAIQRADVSAKQ